jgi:hypothetical protein
MSVHISGQVVQGKADTLVFDCATGGGATSGGVIAGSIIDRLALARAFTHCQPFVIGSGLTNTSTAGAKVAKLDVYLQHGDSSNGGDMAEVNSGLRVVQQQIFNSGELTTDYKVWATGAIRVQHTGANYALLGAKRFLRSAAIVTRLGLSTATTGANDLTVSLGTIMLRPDEEPPSRKALLVDGTKIPLFATSTAT